MFQKINMKIRRLAGVSDVFKRAISGDKTNIAENSKPINIDDATPDEFLAFLHNVFCLKEAKIEGP